jgi:hypothetical protein
VLEDGETRVAGWTLFSPREMNSTGGAEFEEKILLLVRSHYWGSCVLRCNLTSELG